MILSNCAERKIIVFCRCLHVTPDCDQTPHRTRHLTKYFFFVFIQTRVFLSAFYTLRTLPFYICFILQ